MVRTQIQLPEELYARAKEIAEAKEISLAELSRRGLELILLQYPAPQDLAQGWRPPVVDGLGWKDLSDSALKAAAQISRLEEELESQATSNAGG